MEKLKKGSRFIHSGSGKKCFISNIKGKDIRLSFIDEAVTPQIWDREDFEKALKMSKFIHIPITKITRETIALHLIEYELNMVGKTIEETDRSSTWYSDSGMTEEQREMFKGYAIPLIRKVYKCSKKRAEETFKWFDFMYGLRIIKTDKNE